MIKVLFVCLGNICRSPTAEGAFRKLVREHGLEDHIHVDSAGTHDYHVGHPPDARAQAAAAARGIELANLRGRRATQHDLMEFDYVLAMDAENHENLRHIAGGVESNITLLMDYADNYDDKHVPDPYYGGEHGFERVLDLIEDAAEGLLREIRSRHSL